MRRAGFLLPMVGLGARTLLPCLFCSSGSMAGGAEGDEEEEELAGVGGASVDAGDCDDSGSVAAADVGLAPDCSSLLLGPVAAGAVACDDGDGGASSIMQCHPGSSMRVGENVQCRVEGLVCLKRSRKLRRGPQVRASIHLQELK